MKNKPYFPMFIDLSDKNIVVVGGGNIATRRVKTLLSFTRNIRVIAPKVTMGDDGAWQSRLCRADHTSGEAYRLCDGIYGDRSYQ